ncbi:rRNA maturation RNase YbeY [Sporosalibacterium faouarense]|uniref:rRNA maturation RNase YbeY n=1 Tax=Sporosalibacterium faouarense TaxID=516123 RepID=UPI00141D67D0|nr:rRNA maturation RNase YbeY [Sporosalibacterium faouarense]MTI49412.1 rRNA maturation RNase YbeY [Bacillota bacterium]
MELIVDNRQDSIELKEDILCDLEKVIAECLSFEGKSLNYEISVSFVDDNEIRDLNKAYRGKDKSTDVLSFPLIDGEADEEPSEFFPVLLGDIVISLETAKRQAEEYEHSLKREVFYLAVHSMFHLLGYDHMVEEEKKIMREKEKQVMKSLEVFKK